MHACNVSPVAFLAGEPRISASGSIMRFRSGSIGPLSRFRGTPSPSIGCCVFRIDVCYRKLGTECGQTRSRKNGENNSNRVGTHERRWMALLAISAFWQLCGSFTAPAAVDFGTEHQHRSLSLVQALGEVEKTRFVGRNTMTDCADHGGAQSWLVPVIQGNG